MARASKIWRFATLVGATALALGLAATAFAQAPPSPPHQFYGTADAASGALVDGAAVADGATVTAWNQDGEAVGTAAIDNGTWLISVDPADATSVTFSVDGSSATASTDVVSGALAEIAIDATSADADADADTDADADADADDDADADTDTGTAAPTLPNTGTGGLAGSGSSLPVLPLALVAAVILALGGVAATRRSLR